MSTAHADAIGMACVAALFLGIGALALRLRLRTGQRNQWLYVGPAVALVALVIMVINLGGTAVVGG
jgi:uncharacterized membrane protein